MGGVLIAMDPLERDIVRAVVADEVVDAGEETAWSALVQPFDGGVKRESLAVKRGQTAPRLRLRFEKLDAETGL